MLPSSANAAAPAGSWWELQASYPGCVLPYRPYYEVNGQYPVLPLVLHFGLTGDWTAFQWSSPQIRRGNVSPAAGVVNYDTACEWFDAIDPLNNRERVSCEVDDYLTLGHPYSDQASGVTLGAPPLDRENSSGWSQTGYGPYPDNYRPWPVSHRWVVRIWARYTYLQGTDPRLRTWVGYFEPAIDEWCGPSSPGDGNFDVAVVNQPSVSGLDSVALSEVLPLDALEGEVTRLSDSVLGVGLDPFDGTAPDAVGAFSDIVSAFDARVGATAFGQWWGSLDFPDYSLQDCPVYTLTLPFFGIVTYDAQCDIADEIGPMLSAVMLVFFSIMALRVLLGA